MTLEVVKMSSFLEFSLHFYNTIPFEKVFFLFKSCGYRFKVVFSSKKS